MAFWAVLDACVLHPIALADALLWVAHAGVYQPLWSPDILEELRHSVLERLPEANIDRRITAMTEAFPEAEVSGYAPVIDGLMNDPGDRHVLAAAIVGNAQVIVTPNHCSAALDASSWPCATPAGTRSSISGISRPRSSGNASAVASVSIVPDSTSEPHDNSFDEIFRGPISTV